MSNEQFAMADILRGLRDAMTTRHMAKKQHTASLLKRESLTAFTAGFNAAIEIIANTEEDHKQRLKKEKSMNSDPKGQLA